MAHPLRPGRRRRRRRLVALGVSTAAVLLGLGVVTGSAVLLTRTERPGATTTARSPEEASGTSDSTGGSSGADRSGADPGSGSTSTTTVPKSADPVVALVQALDGAYNGTWSNATAHTEGQVALRLRIDPATSTLQVTADLNGDLFGRGTPKRRHLESTINLLTPNQTSTLSTTDFGVVIGTVDPTFAVLLDAPDVPDPGVQRFAMRGVQKLDGSGFAATFTVVSDAGAVASGTMNVACSASGQRPSAVVTLCDT